MLPQAGYGAYGAYGGFKDDPRGMKKRNPLARLLSRHGGMLALLLMAALAVTGVAFAGQAKTCRAATARLASLEAEHGAVKHTGDRTRELAEAKAREAASLGASLEEARKLAAEKERRVAVLESELAAAKAAHGGAAADAATAAGLRAELDIQKARVDTLTRELVDAKRALETKEAAWAAERASLVSGGGGGGGADHHEDHTGFLQVAKLLEEQGVKDPRGPAALAATLAKFFEDQMAAVMAKFEAGGAVPDTPSHDISTQLITQLSALGVTSEHGLDHLFTTVDHLVDAALTHWAPAPDDHGSAAGGDHHDGAAAAHPHGEPHPAPVPGHGDAAHPGHAGGAAAHGHDAGHGHGAAGHGHAAHGHETPKPHHKPDASGFVM